MARDRYIPVSRADLRALFNTHYLERFQHDEFDCRRIENGYPEPDADFPLGTRGQRVVLREKESGDMVAIVHWFLLPSGELGASGRPDPKQVHYGGFIYYWDEDLDEE